MKRRANPTYRKLLLRAIGSKAFADAIKSYDLLGSTAVIEADAKTAKVAAGALMRSNPRIETVLRKGGAVSGRYRTRRYYYVKGAKSFDIECRENGCVFRFDIRNVFFSPRLSFERARIAGLCGDGERVIVMFSGVGPFAIEIARSHRRSEVVGIELNKAAHGYAVENSLLNKTTNFKPVRGDVRKLGGIYASFADRIIMPLPMSSYDFLETALEMAKSRCTIHYYAFGPVSDPFGAQVAKVRQLVSKGGRKMKVLSKRVVRTYSAREVEIVLDVRVGT